MKLIRSLLKYWPVGVIIGLTVWVGFVNRLAAGEWLTGWDNLHSEFAPGLNISRSWSAVWQEYQGLGLQGGMGHAADLGRQVLLAVAGLVLPVRWLRYVYHLVMYGAGMMGVYLVTRLVLEKRVGNSAKNMAALVAALYYGFNLGSILYLYVPFEPYSTFWGMFPWTLLMAWKYWGKPSKANLVGMVVVNVLAVAQGYVQTLFLVYFLCLALLVGAKFLRSKKRDRWEKGLVILSVVVGVNAFWLLPGMFYVISAVDVHNNAAQIKFSTEMFYLMNQAKGKIVDLATMRLFYYDFTDWDNQGAGFGLLPGVWHGYYQFGPILALAAGLFGLGVVGAVLFGWESLGLLMIFLLGLMGLLSAEPGVRELNMLLRNNELISQVFRNPYTKLIVPLVFSVSVFMGVLVGRVIDAREKLVGKLVGTGGWLLLVVAVGLMAWPALKGNLFYQAEKVAIPVEYESLKSYFDNEVSNPGRIITFPAHYVWGWRNHDWGYRGSGFLWYGVEQPIVDRAFDVWSQYNEGLYSEVSSAIYGQDWGLLDNVLDKYDVRYVLLDESVTDAGFDERVFGYSLVRNFVVERGYAEVFRDGFLTVWETPYGKQEEYVEAPGKFSLAEVDTVKVRRDVVWDETGEYVAGLGGLKYPFADLMREELRGTIYGDVWISWRREGVGEGELVVPGMKRGEKGVVKYRASFEEGKVKVEWMPLYQIDGIDGQRMENDEVELGSSQNGVWVKVGGDEARYLKEGESGSGAAEVVAGEPVKWQVYEGVTEREDNLSKEFSLGRVQKCWSKEGVGSVARGEVTEGAMRLWTQNAAACLALPLAASTQDELLQVVVRYKSDDGVRPQLCLDEATEPYRCENLDVKSLVAASTDWAWVVRTIGAKAGEQYWLDVSSQPAEPVSKIRSIDYELPIVRRYRQLAEREVSSEELMREKRLEVRGGELFVRVPRVKYEYDPMALGREVPLNCDVLGRGAAERAEGSYMADEYGAYCDYLELTRMTPATSYLLRLVGKNVEGRSLKIYLHNSGSGRNDLEYLMDEGEFDQSFVVLPWKFDGKYVLNLETRSFGQRAENRLETVEVNYFPLEVLARAKMGQGGRIANELTIRDVRKTGTWLYKVGLEGRGLVTLSQGYDEGWVAYAGGRWVPHLKVDGWKNGWLLEQEQGRIVIFYWPQLLEYLGFVILAGTVVWVVKKHEK